MDRIAPSQRAHQQIEALLAGDFSEAEDLLGKLVRLGIQRMAQEALEEEVTDALGRGHSERRREGEPFSRHRSSYRTAAMPGTQDAQACGGGSGSRPTGGEGGGSRGDLRRGTRGGRARRR